VVDEVAADDGYQRRCYLRDHRDTSPALANYARHAIGEVLAASP
jgi:hypothetical protein